MMGYLVPRENAPTLQFTGELLTTIESSAFYEWKKQDRWEELRLYKTDNYRCVCEHSIYSNEVGEPAYSNYAKVCDTLEEVKDFFGHGWLAQQLYKATANQFTEEV